MSKSKTVAVIGCGIGRSHIAEGYARLCDRYDLHFPQAMAALAAGKEVICEKPLVGSLQEIDQLTAAETGARGRIMPVFQYRFGNGLQKARRIVELGLAGKPYLATVETAWLRGAKYYSVPWRGRFETSWVGRCSPTPSTPTTS
jgi:predicted dehydrogenase